ncbi:hypothetical protein [Saccharicrinis aurantiacus]|uniref:hypothetical protein n=1 Tax=Saccharicrinis aurantiacus TaxID=1849719 RepID=UPI00248FC7DE|nr:hypothetical protein [Saccharicrinis aurantiacus]
MKKINLLYILIMFIAFVSCNDEYVAPNSFTDVSWYSPTFKGNDFDRYPLLGQRDYFSIVDISQGEEEHKWELLNDSIFFLEGEIVRNDTTLAEKVAGGGMVGDVSEDKTVHLYFPKGGIQSVRLYNTFEEEVTFKAKDTTLTSVFDEKLGLHVFEHIFTVDVYHDVVAKYRVYRENGDEIDLSGSDTITIDIANREKLYFAQNVDSIYHITGVNWQFPKAVPSTSSQDSVAVTFYTPGVVKNIAFTASRSGQNIPPGSDRVILPLIINVGDGPFTPVEITKGDATTLKVQLSGSLDGNLSSSDFTVVAKNADLGQDFNIDVASVTMEQDNSLAVLTLSESIYVNDEVHVSYVGTGHKATDKRPLEPGTVILAPIPPINNVNDGGFEAGSGKWISPPSFEGGRVTDPASYSTDYAEDGMYSMHAIKTAGGQTAFSNGSGFVLEEGVTYTYSFSYYAISTSKEGGAFEARISPLLDNGNVQESKLEGAWNGLNGLKIGEWTTKSYTIVGDGKKYTVAVLFYGGSAVEVYFDNFSVVANNNRPMP